MCGSRLLVPYILLMPLVAVFADGGCGENTDICIYKRHMPPYILNNGSHSSGLFMHLLQGMIGELI